MTRLNLSKLIGSAATVACLLSITGQGAQAGEFHNGWNYTLDSFMDGSDALQVGAQSEYEFYGMAMTQTDDSVIFAINANLGINGTYDYFAADNNIAWGDLILNFSGSDKFNKATDLYGIKFSENDSGVTELGVYSNVTTTSVTSFNNGYGNIDIYNDTVFDLGGTPSLGDFNGKSKYIGDDPDFAYLSDNRYFNINQATQTSIASGTKVADINLIDDFSGLGLDFDNFGATGTHTFGFSFDKSALPSGDFIAHLFEECGNDGMALVGNIEEAIIQAEKVPEPTAMAGLAVFGLGLFSRRRRKDDCSAE